MMHKGPFLMKEICFSSEHTAEFQGVISTPLSIKEVFEVRHEFGNPRTIIGENVIAYFGEILVKIFFITKENATLSLAEQTFHYRGFIFPEKGVLAPKQSASLSNKVLDIFVQMQDEKEITISGIISTELTLTREKKIKNFRALTETISTETVSTKTSPFEESESTESDVADYEAAVKDSPVEDDNLTIFTDSNRDDEIYTEVNSGYNQDITFILE